MNKKTKRPQGRPRTIKSPEEFDRRANEYFQRCENEKKPVLLTGLILALGLSSKNAFYEYEKRDGFKDSVKSARLRVEQRYEELLQAGCGAGAIFALKNFDWKDKQEIDHNHGGLIEAIEEGRKRAASKP